MNINDVNEILKTVLNALKIITGIVTVIQFKDLIMRQEKAIDKIERDTRIISKTVKQNNQTQNDTSLQIEKLKLERMFSVEESNTYNNNSAKDKNIKETNNFTEER